MHRRTWPNVSVTRLYWLKTCFVTYCCSHPIDERWHWHCTTMTSIASENTTPWPWSPAHGSDIVSRPMCWWSHLPPPIKTQHLLPHPLTLCSSTQGILWEISFKAHSWNLEHTNPFTSKLQMYQPWGQQGRCILRMLPTYPTYELDASYFTPSPECIISARTGLLQSMCSVHCPPRCTPKFCAIPK